jgi:hypothetical protein
MLSRIWRSELSRIDLPAIVWAGALLLESGSGLND